MEKVRFFARGEALVTDFKAALQGVRRFVGRRWMLVDAPDREGGRGWAWVPTDVAHEVELLPEYVRAAKKGDLWPADEASAKACGVKFDPNFGEPKSDKSHSTNKDIK